MKSKPLQIIVYPDDTIKVRIDLHIAEHKYPDEFHTIVDAAYFGAKTCPICNKPLNVEIVKAK